MQYTKLCIHIDIHINIYYITKKKNYIYNLYNILLHMYVCIIDAKNSIKAASRNCIHKGKYTNKYIHKNTLKKFVLIYL